MSRPDHLKARSPSGLSSSRCLRLAARGIADPEHEDSPLAAPFGGSGARCLRSSAGRRFRQGHLDGYRARNLGVWLVRCLGVGGLRQR